MNKICPMQLQAALQARITEGLSVNLEGKASAIAIDGKVLRGTRSDHAKTVQILAAVDQYTGCVLSETQVAAGTNEGKTALELLKGHILHGRTVVGDAAFCLREICDAIHEQRGQYQFPFKDNQPNLHKEAIQAFVIPEGFSPYAKRKALEARRSASTIEKNRGRIERRTLTTTTVGTDTSDWPGLRLFLKLEREVTVKGKTTKTVNYAVTSNSIQSATPERLLGFWRDRWSLEN